jgi:Kef-type K+ transport system membrane component KefB
MHLPSFVTRIGAGIRSVLSRVTDRIGAALLRLMRPWERLPVPAQVAIAFPTLSVLLFLFHLGPLGQPPIRAIFYGVFWSILATPAIVVATQNELRKRDRREATGTPDQG